MKVTGARAVVECLVEQQVNTVFGYPGGMILPLFDALYGETRIQTVVNVHEQCAAHAADGYARATGRVGVCIATSGPGATNLITGLAAAFMDSIPVIAITGQVETGSLGHDAFQEIDILGATMSVTKHNFAVKTAQELPETVRLAFKIALSGRPGPVLIDIPQDILREEIEFRGEDVYQRVMPALSERSLGMIGKAARLISDAKRPLILSGGGVISAGASEELIKLAEKCNLPVVHTLMGLGGFPDGHDQSIGLSGMHGWPTANHAVHDADVVIAVGTRLSDRLTGNRDRYARDKRIIHIDIDPAEIAKNVSTDIGIAGDIRTILNLLTVEAEPNDITEWWNEIHAWQEKFRYQYAQDKLTVPWTMRQISNLTLDKDCIYVTDVGQHQMWAAQHIVINHPRTWLTSGGLGAMGFSLPAALGAQLARPDKRVIHIAGDGGMRMTGNELYTIAALKLPIISVVVDNHGLGMIRQLQKVFYNDRYCACRMPHPMDFSMYANSFGIDSVTVSTQAEFLSAMEEALKENAPRVIVVNVEEEFVDPMAKPRAPINQFVDFK
ncbi:MAG: biosynthetic-type acetolactate synthase large subunit [Selenomonadales bacterium]|nr:biosynthetic-type acetolactate synthase large subunit [Selenomonadales bacterium]